MVTLALIGIAAAVAFPLASVTSTRLKEAQLRSALITLRTALDAYKAAADSGAIDKPTGSSGYPPNLDILVTGAPLSAAMGAAQPPVVFLRRIPRDPFAADPDTPPAATWNQRRYGATLGDFAPGKDVFDVSSKSTRKALNGTRLDDW